MFFFHVSVSLPLFLSSVEINKIFKKNYKFLLFIDLRDREEGDRCGGRGVGERERGRERLIVPLTDTFIG